MVREIVKDPILLGRKSAEATQEDLLSAQDLIDTFMENRAVCVGMAANMIGVLKRIIVLELGGQPVVMFNPEILRTSGPYMAEEGCLSLDGIRETKRWKTIRLKYQNADFQTRIKVYSGFEAQIIQHEIDHCDGILI